MASTGSILETDSLSPIDIGGENVKREGEVTMADPIYAGHNKNGMHTPRRSFIIGTIAEEGRGRYDERDLPVVRY